MKADETYCQQKRTQYGLTMPVLIDPTNALALPDNDIDIVLERGMGIVLRRQYGPESAVTDAIDEVLGL